MSKITKSTIDKVKTSSTVLTIAQSIRKVDQKGNQYTCECPSCGNPKMSLVSRGDKDLFKCFKCDLSGQGAISYLMKVEGMNYPEAVKYIAKDVGIEVEYEDNVPIPVERNTSFLERQLQSSGIELNTIKYTRQEKGIDIEHYRFTSGTMSYDGKIDPQGDDMLIHYLDLDYAPITWAKNMPYVRLRLSNPELRKTKSGKAPKYISPKGSGNQLYIPNVIIDAYQSQTIIETLIVTEGEKKSEKLCQEGVFAVAISGIHNFSPVGKMSSQFQNLIRRCQVQSVVFLLDSDWDEVKFENKSKVDQRPRSFARAVQKFRDYFYAYTNEEIYLHIYFAYTTDKQFKGVDDLLKWEKDVAKNFSSDLNKALVDQQGQGKYVQTHKITTIGDYKINEIFEIHNRQSFFNKYESELLKLKEFYYRNIKYTVQDGKIELAQQLLPNEQFWEERIVQSKFGEYEKYEFDYQNARVFLKNRGFKRYQLPSSHKKVTIREQNRVIEEVDHEDVQQYMINFLENHEHKKLLNFILKGYNQYIGPNRLQHLYKADPTFHDPRRDVQYLYFQDQYWEITAEGIESKKYNEIDHYIWKDQIIDFAPTLIDPIFTIHKENGALEVVSDNNQKQCQILDFMFRTSDPYHHKSTRTPEEVKVIFDNMISKILAAGYILHDFKDYANMKAVVCMDSEETEIGTSQGGTGKSLFSMMFKHMMPCHIIDGKSPRLTEDAHIYDGVDDRTQLLIFDDCRVNLDFEFFFSQITRGVTVNPKGERKFTIPAPKFIFNTNHAINGSGNSFERRQFLLSFSNFFSASRTPRDFYGGLLFTEWDSEQWNYFYNTMARCIQSYLKYGLIAVEDHAQIEKRRLRQFIGEDFMEWADLFFDREGEYRNHKVEKNALLRRFHHEYPKQKRYTDNRAFKKKIIKYCEYHGLEFNPQKSGGRIHSMDKEYFCIADDQFRAAFCDYKEVNVY